METTYNHYCQSAEYIKSFIDFVPDVAIILGSGLDSFIEKIENPIVIPYKDIPNFPKPTLYYQKGELVLGKAFGKNIVAMNGRFHCYEGYTMREVAFPIGVFKLLGVKALIVTNAAGGISEDYSIGDLVCVRDHIKLVSDSSLRGENISELGERFFDMQSVYDENLAKLAHEIAKKHNITLKDGIYAYMSGPNYETPAEIKVLKLMGATVVGMSTVPEIISAAHCGLPVLCISFVTNKASGIGKSRLDEKEVVINAKNNSENIEIIAREIIKKI